MRYLLTEADDGKVVSTRVGDSLEVRLNEVPSGGYTWFLEDPLDTFLSCTALPFDFEPGSVGGASTARFVFAVKAPGRGVFRFHYKRSWEREPALRTFEVEVIAAEQG